MALLLDRIPSILLLAVLVGIFVSLRRHMKSPRLTLWIAAWVLVFVHVAAQSFEPKEIPLGPPPFSLGLILSLDYGALQLSAMFFIASLATFYDDKKRTFGLLCFNGLPVLIYSFATAFNLNAPPLYIACLCTSFIGAPVFALYFRRKDNPEKLFWLPFCLVLGTWAIYRAWHGDHDFGFNATLAGGFALPGVLFRRRYRRWSPGVITSMGGFLLWGAVFPVGALLDKYYATLSAHINPELWNTPKYLVAFGMILALLEEKSAVLESSREREHKLNEQLQKFARITSRLLTGVEVNSLCNDIAHAITETSTFQRAVILLTSDDRALFVAGSSGMDEQDAAELKQKCTQWKIDALPEMSRIGRKIGQNSFLLTPEQAQKYNCVRSKLEYPQNPYWMNGNKLFVPLQSTRGTHVGCISLDDPRDVARVTAEEMSKIELLAGDLAVTIDNTTLHRQLVRSEKLAAIGQLVAGVAHELNNPLASIVGYSELLTDEVPAESSRRKLEKLLREAQRMKRIIENLLRFARQNHLEKKSANIQGLLQEVVSLREYHLRNHNIAVQIDIEDNLPSVALDEDQFKQILLNLLNNSIDALEHASRKRIHIEASRVGDRVLVRFDDTGPGFADLNRAFDPFFTTKPIGKGTGLGLSICYGIVKEHGGDIYAVNKEPNGARIVLELPIYSPVASTAAS
ncbi:MAG TPA: HAMP domain-containing sensor histidine kinase [Candidatus Angelobacter sp.]|jgi:signal transduction histidine kinase|nr:HAMP domain-containing sensor histidine kinase [Candidatus Angelobacter sp.]